MPTTPYIYREWAWNQFNLENNQGELDIINDSSLKESGLSRTEQLRYETRFIDELYGTDNAQWVGQGTDLPYDYGGKKGVEGILRGPSVKGKSSQLSVNPEEHVLLGLDLKRVDNEALEVGSNKHYTHLTRGKVDWAYYKTDTAWQAAFKKADVDTDYLWGDSATTQWKVERIRQAAEHLGATDDDVGAEPDGNYNADNIYTKDVVDETGKVVGEDLYIGGKRQETLSERYNTIDPVTGKKGGRLPVGFTYTRKDEDGNNVEVSVDDEGGLSESAFDPISGPPSTVVKPTINIPDVKVKVPASLKQWKSDAKQTLKVGGTRRA